MSNGSDVVSKSLYLPDFCTSRAALANVLIVELTAVVLTLARENEVIGFWTDLTVKRSEFGMDKMLEGIGDEVPVSIGFEAGKK